MQTHILLPELLEILAKVDNFELKTLSQGGELELNSYPKGWEVRLQNFFSDLSPHLIPWYPNSGIILIAS